MRAVKILLLSCLYPLVLFFAIGYTFSYTSPHASTKDISESKGINLREVSFLSPNPTTIILQEDTMDFVSASGTAKVAEQRDVQATDSADLVDASEKISSVSANALAKDPTQNESLPTPTESTVFPTISPSQPVQQGSVPAKSVTIIDSAASSVVVPQSSTRIIEDNPVMQSDTCTNTTPC